MLMICLKTWKTLTGASSSLKVYLQGIFQNKCHIRTVLIYAQLIILYRRREDIALLFWLHFSRLYMLD